MLVAGAVGAGVFGVLRHAQSADAEAVGKAPTLEGTWRWDFVMPDGTTNRPKLRFSVEEGQLSGVTSFRTGTETDLTNLVVIADRVSFQVVRRRSDRDIVTTYSGKWSDQSIKGKIESDWAGEKQTFDWEAVRAHHGVEGVWRSPSCSNSTRLSIARPRPRPPPPPPPPKPPKKEFVQRQTPSTP